MMVHFAYRDHTDLNLFASHHQRILNPSWMNWVSGYFVCRVFPWLRIFTATNKMHNFVFILCSMNSPERNYIYIFLKVKKKNVIRCHCRQPYLAANLPSLYRVYHGSKSSLNYFMFVYFLFILLLSFSLFLLQNVVI